MRLNLKQQGRDELALAIALWRDFRMSHDDRNNLEVSSHALTYARLLNVEAEYKKVEGRKFLIQEQK